MKRKIVYKENIDISEISEDFIKGIPHIQRLSEDITKITAAIEL